MRAAACPCLRSVCHNPSRVITIMCNFVQCTYTCRHQKEVGELETGNSVIHKHMEKVETTVFHAGDPVLESVMSQLHLCLDWTKKTLMLFGLVRCRVPVSGDMLSKCRKIGCELQQPGTHYFSKDCLNLVFQTYLSYI